MATHTTTISGVTYEVTESLADDGLPILCSLANLAAGGPELKSMSMVGLLLSAMANKDLKHVIKECTDQFGLMTQVVAGSKRVQLATIFTSHFQGKYKDLISWLTFCLKVNYGDAFLEVFQKLVSKGKTTESESGSPSTPETVG